MSATYKSKKILVKRTYQILAGILIILAFGLVMLPEHQRHEGITPEVYVKNMISAERYISSDQLAEKMINEDPSLLIIDTRSPEEYASFSLPNAINIPLSEIFNEELNIYLDQDTYDVVLYSNDNFLSNEIWMIGNRMGYQRLYVLKGGLNEWFNTIIQPEQPTETMSQRDHDLHSFRLASGKYFGVNKDTVEIEVKVTKVNPAPAKEPEKKKVTPKPKKKKRMPEGGC